MLIKNSTTLAKAFFTNSTLKLRTRKTPTSLEESA